MSDLRLVPGIGAKKEKELMELGIQTDGAWNTFTGGTERCKRIAEYLP